MTENPLYTYANSLTPAGNDPPGYLEIFPGIELYMIGYQGEGSSFHHEELPDMLQINYCLEGRIGWEMRNGVSIYFGAGDLALHTMDCCAISSMSTPLGYYKAVTLSVDMARAAKESPALLKEAKIQIPRLIQKLCPDGKPFCLPANRETAGIFSVFTTLADLPRALYVPYCRLKVQELFLYLERLDPEKEKPLDQYHSEQVEQIKEIHQFLTHNLDRRFTIETLSRRYLINTSSLKKIFRSVYGQPIATYIKEYRIHKAMKLLRTTDDSVAAIAKSLSYENQGKFTKAFKDITQMMPTEYRRLYTPSR